MEQLRQRLLAEGFSEDQVERYLQALPEADRVTDTEVDALVSEAYAYFGNAAPESEPNFDATLGPDREPFDSEEGDAETGEDTRVVSEEDRRREELQDDPVAQQAAAAQGLDIEGMTADELLLFGQSLEYAWIEQEYGVAIPETELRRLTALQRGIPVSQVTDEMVTEDFGSSNGQNRQVLDAITAGQAPTMTVKYGPSGNERTVTVNQGYLEGIRARLPGADQFIPSLIIANDRAGGDETRLFGVAAAAAQRGMFDPLDTADEDALIEEATDRRRQQMWDSVRNRFVPGTVNRDQGEGGTASFWEVIGNVFDATRSPERVGREAARAVDAITSAIRTVQLGQIAEEYERAYSTYQDGTLAYISATGRDDLAQQLYNDPWSMSIEDRNALNQVLNGFDPESAGAAGMAVNTPNYNFISSIANWGGGGDGSDGASASAFITLPDADQLEEQIMRPLFQGLLLRDPTDAELKAYSDSIRSLTAAKQRAEIAVRNPLRGGTAADRFNPLTGPRGFEDGADGGGLRVGQGDDISPQGKALEAIRSSAEYQQLYANRRSGESEEAYQNRIGGGASRLFSGAGGDVAIGDLREGLMTGDAQTTTGRTFFRDQSENSAFQERMARLGERMRSLT